MGGEYSSTTVKCRDYNKATDSDAGGVVHVSDFGGTLETAPLVGSAQPVQVIFDPRVYGWIQFDELDYEIGKTISGRFAASEPRPNGTELGGRFIATLCNVDR